MLYPELNIYVNKIEENARRLKEKLALENIKLTAVVKGLSGDSRVFKAYKRAGIESVADSRIENIIKYRNAGYRGEAVMLRVPMPSEIKELVKYINTSLISEIKTAELISKEALKINKKIDLIIMVDIGDRREGVLPADLNSFALKIENLPGVQLKGIGTNLGCFAGVVPDRKNTMALIKLKKELENELERKVDLLSAGNTATLNLLADNELAAGISNLRVGEGILIGTDIINERVIEGLNHYNFRLKAEVIELKEKPSNPEGTIAFGGQGRNQKIEDKGIRKRAILAVGKQDIDYQGLYPELKGIEVLGASSDHLITDITDLEKKIEVGDFIKFKLNYSAVLRAMTSAYVSKNYIN